MIWLIGGTSDSVLVAQLITQLRLAYIVSVTTKNARQLYNSIEPDHIFVGKLDLLEIPHFLQLHGIKKVIDCSHPFATKISQAVINVCQYFNLPYLRYERPSLKRKKQKIESALISYINSFSLLTSANSPLQNKRVLLTIGVNNLHLFQNYHSQATLFARILPYPQSLAKAYAAGFTCDRIIAIRPPTSPELEKALWQLWQIEIVITKASGKAGGENIKAQIAAELNTSLIVVSRPVVFYPLVTNQLEDITNFVLDKT